MSAEDPSLWQQISGWLWALLAVPLKMLWSKADNAATKAELASAIKAMADSAAEARGTMRTLFDNAEKDRADANARFTEIRTEAAERAAVLSEKLHALHVEVVSKR